MKQQPVVMILWGALSLASLFASPSRALAKGGETGGGGDTVECSNHSRLEDILERQPSIGGVVTPLGYWPYKTDRRAYAGEILESLSYRNEFDVFFEGSGTQLTLDAILYFVEQKDHDQAASLRAIRRNLSMDRVRKFSDDPSWNEMETGLTLSFQDRFNRSCDRHYTARQFFEQNHVELLEKYYDQLSVFQMAVLRWHELALHRNHDLYPTLSLPELEGKARADVLKFLNMDDFYAVTISKVFSLSGRTTWDLWETASFIYYRMSYTECGKKDFKCQDHPILPWLEAVDTLLKSAHLCKHDYSEEELESFLSTLEAHYGKEFLYEKDVIRSPWYDVFGTNNLNLYIESCDPTLVVPGEYGIPLKPTVQTELELNWKKATFVCTSQAPSEPQYDNSLTVTVTAEAQSPLITERIGDWDQHRRAEMAAHSGFSQQLMVLARAKREVSLSYSITDPTGQTVAQGSLAVPDIITRADLTPDGGIGSNFDRSIADSPFPWDQFSLSQEGLFTTSTTDPGRWRLVMPVPTDTRPADRPLGTKLLIDTCAARFE